MLGFNATDLAILNVSDAAAYAVDLAGNSRLINKVLQVDVQAFNDEPVLSSYGAVNFTHFYHFDYPFNQFSINKTSDELYFNVLANEAEKQIARVTLRPSKEPIIALRSEFSGRYALHGKDYFSRVIVRKSPNLQSVDSWRCDLEINMPSNVTESVELSRIEAQEFNALRLISTEHTTPKSSHYVFLENANYSEIEEDFLGYRFSRRAANPVIVLQHRHENAQTIIFLKKMASAIVINNIQYAINWAFSTLLAVATKDGSIIDGRRLLAPLKIDKDFRKEEIVYRNGVYTIGNIRIKNPSPKLKVHFNDVKLSFGFLQYQSEMNSILVEPVVAYLHDREQRQENQKETSWWNSLSNSWVSFLLPVAAGTALSLFFSKRLLWSRSVVASSGVANAIVPLLNMPTTDAVLIGEKKPVPDSLERSDWPLGNDKGYKDQLNTDNYPTDWPVNDWNFNDQQLILSAYLGMSLKKLFFKSPKTLTPLVRIQKAENTPISQSSGVSFFATKSASVSHTVVAINESLLVAKGV